MKLLSVFFLLLILSIQVILFNLDKSPTAHEFAHHIASGYSELITGDFRMNPAEPPVSRLLSAIPLYFLGVNLPLNHWSWKEGNSPEFARQFFYNANHNQDQIVFWARVPILIVSMIFGYFVFVWASELFGFIGGISALIIYVFSPEILAHSGLATSDLTVAFFFYMTLWRFWKYLKKPTLKNIILTAIMSGLAMASKFSAILIFPTLILILITQEISERVCCRN